MYFLHLIDLLLLMEDFNTIKRRDSSTKSHNWTFTLSQKSYYISIWIKNLHSHLSIRVRQFRYLSYKLTSTSTSFVRHSTLCSRWKTVGYRRSLDTVSRCRFTNQPRGVTIRESNPKVRDLWQRNGHVRERISSCAAGGSRDLWPPAWFPHFVSRMVQRI